MNDLKRTFVLFPFFLLCSFRLLTQTADSILLCTGSSQLFTTSPTGVLYDSGGPFGGYGEGQYCTLLINPGCATALTFRVHEYSTENCCDVLRIFDGENENAPLLLDMYANQAPQTVTSSSGKLFVRWTSDWSVSSSGFRATWESILVPQTTPVANIAVSETQPPLQAPVQFTATSTNFPQTWNWDFGDNTTSNEQNPVHAWNAPGTYIVRLIATNCHNLKDTVEQTITVQPPPFVEVNPASLDLTVACGDTAHATVTVTNSGQGDLLFNLSGQYDAKLKVLILTNGAYYLSVDGLTAAMDDYFTNYELAFSAAGDSATFANELADKDILIIPDLISSEAAWNLMTLRGAIEDFVETGGSIIVCGHNYYNAFTSATGLLDAENDYTGNFSNSLITFGGPHPLTEGLPVSYFTSYFSGGHVFLDPDYNSLCNVSNYSLLGYRLIGRAKIVYLGFNYQTPDAALARLLANALQWCGSRSLISITPAEGVVPPGASIDLNLQILTTQQVAGDYSGNLVINTNNPAQTVVNVPFILHVQGNAVLAPAPAALDFDSLMQHREKSLTLRIDNPGCDTLSITSIASSIPGFTATPSQTTILPFSTDSVSVTFAPVDTGAYAGDLVLVSNTGETNIPLSGYATGAPIVGFMPLSLEATLACGDSTLLSVEVTNTGLGDLNIATGNAAIGGASPLKILMIYRGTYDYFICSQVNSMILQRFPNAVITIFDSQPLNEFPALLADNHLVVIPFTGGYDPSFYSVLSQDLRAFAENGGGVIFTGSFFQQNIAAYGLLPASTNSNGYYAPPLTILDPSHPLLTNVTFQTPVFDDVFGHTFSNSDFVPLVQMYQLQAVGVQQIGLGKVAYLGIRYAYFYDQTGQLLENTVRWCSRPGWATVKPAIAGIAPGETAVLQVKFSTEGLIESTYTSVLKWSTNDPLSPQIELPCTLHVEGEPQLEVSLPNLNFGIIQQFAQKTLDVPIYNTGCDTLTLSSPASSNPYFVVTSYPAIVLPNRNGIIKVSYTPQEPGSHTAVLSVETDGGIAAVQLAGLAVGAPVASTTPPALEVDLSCDETTIFPITVQNNGLGMFNFQIGGLNSPRRVLGLTYGANTYRWDNFRTFILQNLPNTSVKAYSGTNSAALADSLEKTDVLVVPPLESFSDPVYSGFKTAIQGFLDNGGQVLVLGSYPTQPLLQMGLFGNFYTEQYYNPGVHVLDSDHPAMLDIAVDFQANDNCYLGIFPPGTDIKALIRGFYASQTYLGYRQIGQGNVVFWAPTFDYNDPGILQLGQNLFTWFANPVPEGLKVLTAGGSVAPGSSQTIQVEMNGSNLPGGQYKGLLRLTGNDPVNNPLVIPITLNMGFEPCADFGFEVPSCSNTVSFFDSTVNALSSWYWDFGDGFSAFTQNPDHTYVNGGAYPVTLVGCNNYGCDTIVKNVEISPSNGPAGINCQPQTTGWCCDAGITRVQIGTLDHFSTNASEGYQDFSCTEGTELMAGSQYPITIITGQQVWEHVKVWIDYNNNGTFGANELVFSDQAYVYHQGFVSLPASAIKDTPLRMRVLSESTWNNPPATPCSNVTYGQAEDYFITLKTMVGTVEPGNDLHTRLYPNPSSGETWLEFSLPEPGSVSIKIADQTARLVWENTLDNTATGPNKVRLPQLPAGAFAVTVQSGNAVSVLKLVRVEGP